MTSPIDSVGPPATLPTTYDPARATVNASGTGKPTEMFDSEMFLNLLVAQLKYQDPTNPVDTSNFMNQTAMLSQVQTMNTMSQTLSDMMTAQQTASATSMIGKAISFVDPSGNQTSGVVDGVSFHSGAAMLHVGDLAVSPSGVLAVADPVPVAGDATPVLTDSTAPTDVAGAASPQPENDVIPVDSTADTSTLTESGSPTAEPDVGISAPVSRPDTITA